MTRLVVGGGRVRGFPRLRAGDVALNIDAGAYPDVQGDIALAAIFERRIPGSVRESPVRCLHRARLWCDKGGGAAPGTRRPVGYRDRKASADCRGSIVAPKRGLPVHSGHPQGFRSHHGAAMRESMISRAYCRCNSGHYFMGECCPFDGWSSPASRELANAVKQLEREGQPVSLENLQKLGLRSATMERTAVIQFGSDTSAFEAVAPHLCVVDDQALPITKLPRSFQ